MKLRSLNVASAFENSLLVKNVVDCESLNLVSNSGNGVRQRRRVVGENGFNLMFVQAVDL